MLPLLLTLPFIISITTANRSEYLRIVNGKPTTISQFPYQVAITYGNQVVCGGSILNERIIITAAHCFYSTGNFLTVQAGMTFIRGFESRQISKVDRVFTHPKYDPNTSDYDMSLALLRAALVFNAKTRPIRITNRLVKGGEMATATGWGHTKSNGRPSNILRYVQLPIISDGFCSVLLRAALTDRMICAGYITGGYDTCQGDSGGPLAIKNELVGITSWGYGCAEPGWPGVYTNVYRLRDWIDDTLISLNLKLHY